MKKTLHLTLKKEWFDLIANGTKKEEYRKIKPYWSKRFIKKKVNEFGVCTSEKYTEYDYVAFKNGYQKNSPKVICEFKGISLGNSKPKWGGNNKLCFIINIGEIISLKNIKHE